MNKTAQTVGEMVIRRLVCPPWQTGHSGELENDIGEAKGKQETTSGADR